MDLSRLTFRDALSRYLRTRTAGLRDRLGAAADTTSPLRPAHGGATGVTGPDHSTHEDADTASRRRRKATYAAVAEFLALPRGTNLDIEVVEGPDQVTFLIRDSKTGLLLRTLSETQAKRVVDLLGTASGSLIDRSL